MASTQIKVGNYVLLETLGVGSFGKVKLAVHSHTGHKVALKIINRRRIATMDMVGRVKREIQYLKLLRHPHIIKLYEVITTPTDIIMVMEYAGGELFNYIVNRGRMSEDDARKFFQQIICAVEYCHRHKIVHRDLKPENVLLDEYDQVKIADFGLSNIMSDGEFLRTSCGSPNYAAPEVINGKLYAGSEVDVWSCGVILYVMLCGRLPFDDDYIPALFKKINGGIFSLPSFLSSPVKSLLQSMLIVDPLKRATIAQIRQLDWFKKGLPDYLQPLPDIPQLISGDIDDSIATEIAKKMGYSKETVMVALKESENNQIKVAYELGLDHRRMLAGVRRSPHKTLHHYLLSESPPAWNAAPPKRNPSPSPLHRTGTPTPSEPPTASSIQVLSSSLPKPEVTAAPPGIGQRARHKTRSKWHFGIRSRSDPSDIMLEIYKALKNIGMKWRTVDSYHIRCRYHCKGGHVVKLDIQLYQVESNNYLVDFKNASNAGDAMGTPAVVPGGTRITLSEKIAAAAAGGRGDPAVPSSVETTIPTTDVGPVSATHAVGVDTPAKATTPTTGPDTPPPPAEDEEDGSRTVYAFFDACARLITELAISA
ncbi:5'-AMP-activated protein kinase catalytic subunit alpha-2 [Fimicolochytrium jonesii]|uniref:5'-AMP-activated protein kinase catalytic subunit alpha-2 n=1 Tax=Fimicolochytrium jonesii TaxID=1396493 RepID=UPI0022FF1ACE|nr:5'-AMP-activated protein kinase catalytic subunit alpha-2 [Fimicolochytrium jonesii]KAI8823376.1 5'-AMP-activated protein kinase catalytic subunit alpha-2 [Fimicolochytrium jonesii]